MDIASRPSTPIENQEAADAAAPPKAPAVIRREDYRPPEWLVPEIALDFALDLEATRVRRPGGAPEPARLGRETLRLNGDGIAARSIMVDGHAANDWRMDGRTC
jgi:aminopeptidase N